MMHVRATGREAAPMPRSYWVVLGRLLAGAYPSSPDAGERAAWVDSLWNAVIRTFINLVEENETNNAGAPFAPYAAPLEECARAGQCNVQFHRFAIRDLGAPSTDVMAQVVCAIDESIAAGNPVYMHCFGGVGRTGTAVCAWLLQQRLADISNVFQVLHDLRRADKVAGKRPAPESDSQRAFVKAWSERVDAMPTVASRIRGCLLGGAIGDALGAPVEFMKLAEIRAKFGVDGIQSYAEAYGVYAAITDDTQMTLFTAEGIIRAYVRAREKGMCHPPSIVHNAYLRWARTQGIPLKAEVAEIERWPDGWLVSEAGLQHRRAPGTTCVSALGDAVLLGDVAKNDSKGCGTVMRVAPVGLTSPARGGRGSFPAFEFAVDISKCTHGHPTGYLAGGYFAHLIALLLGGRALRSAVVDALEPLRAHAGADETIRAVQGAVKLFDSRVTATAEVVESLGGGWVAEEAVAIAVYCALAATSFEHGIRLAANISGDSDSTASMTGQLLGVIGGDGVISESWLYNLELAGVIRRVASDLIAVRSESFHTATEWDRYPGW
jgi:ADP-ribosyl-[dinitrogen reductase] hydrolase